MALSPSHHGKKREKPVLSCSFCRSRKLRCDRQVPCGACVRRGKQVECTYSSSEQERKDAIDYRPRARSQQARQRVVRLENLVTEMRDMAQNSHQQPSDPRAALSNMALNDPVPSPLASDGGHVINDSMGKLSLTDDQAVYINSSHWVTILEDIQHLKDELSEEHPDNDTSLTSTPFDAGLMHQPPAPARISLLSNNATCFPRDQILAMIPPRKVVDRHVSHFFNAFDLAPVIVHQNKFLAEYANFWVSPSAAPTMWIGLLFSVMTMSVFLQQQRDGGTAGSSPAESLQENMLENYRILTIHCLVAGDYLRPSTYTVETLTLHFAVDQNVHLDTDIGNWILMGVVIRIALRMGLHRDPSHWPNIRPLQAELRRRLWMTLYDMDFFTSTQVGLPRIIKESQCDTRPPAHLFDQDVGFESNEIPPVRPWTEPSPLLYLIQRHNIIRIAAEIYDATEAAAPSFTTTAKLSAKLDSAIDGVPAWLKYRPLETSVAENPATILHRMFFDIMVNKAVYLLYRRSFVKAFVQEDGSSVKSNERCIQAALAILGHQRRMNEETEPGGLMSAIRWKVATSLNHEFLQATMMLCLALSRFNENPEALTVSSPALYRRSDILEALIVAKSIWEKNAHRSIEARRAAKAIATTLKQDLDKSSAHSTSTAFSDGLFAQIPGIVAPQSYLGSFDYGQDMVLDPFLFAANDDVSEFGGTLYDPMIDMNM